MASLKHGNPEPPIYNSSASHQKKRDKEATLEKQAHMQPKESATSRERTGDAESRKIAKALRKQAKADAHKAEAITEAEAEAPRKHKKRKRSGGEEVNKDEDRESKRGKKAKKSKKVSVTENVQLDGEETTMKPDNCDEDNKEMQQAAEDVARKERKRLRKLQKEQEASAKTMLGMVQESPGQMTDLVQSKEAKRTSDKGHKSKKKTAIQPDDNRPAILVSAENGGKPVTMSADQWNPDALSGDAARKSKFLRLLGAGKNSSLDASAKPERSTGGTNKNIQRIESELERQFEAGIRMKHDGQSKRRGLGA